MERSPAAPARRETWRRHARRWQREARALYLAARHPRVPWYAKAWLGLLLAYVFSPIDPVPDFVPVLGHLDELVLVPLGLAAALLAWVRRRRACLPATPREIRAAYARAPVWSGSSPPREWPGTAPPPSRPASCCTPSTGDGPGSPRPPPPPPHGLVRADRVRRPAPGRRPAE